MLSQEKHPIFYGINQIANEWHENQKIPLIFSYPLAFIFAVLFLFIRFLPLFIILIIAFFIIAPVSIGALFMAMG